MDINLKILKELYLEEIEKHAGGSFVDFVLYNTGVLPDKLVKRYEKEGKPVQCKPLKKSVSPHFIGANVISTTVPKKRKGDPLVRTLIRHDSDKLARAIMKILHDSM